MIGAPVGIPGKGHEDLDISKWEYGNGLSESTPCFSSPEALIRIAAGPWCPRAVCVDGELLHCNTSSYSDFPVWNS